MAPGIFRFSRFTKKKNFEDFLMTQQIDQIKLPAFYLFFLWWGEWVGRSWTLKESLVLLSGCLQMMKVSRRHTAKIRLRAAMFHTAVPPCTASMLNARMRVPEGRNAGLFLHVLLCFRRS